MTSLNCQTASDPVYTQLAVGSDGFPGNNPAYSGALNRDSYAAYVDFASDITDDLFVDLALRYENFSDFGETFDYKLASRWSVTPDINLRGSVGTGFRAPTPGQLSTINVSTRFPAGEPVAVGLFPATNPVSVFLGAKPLKPETSTNYSVGATGVVRRLRRDAGLLPDRPRRPVLCHSDDQRGRRPSVQPCCPPAFPALTRSAA